jgi:hypothetical protein
MKAIMQSLAIFLIAVFAFVISGVVGDFAFYQCECVWTSSGIFGVSFLGIFTSSVGTVFGRFF